ncbi:hypothetical protein BBK14_08925 [Parafrankia soli]|uniref:Uncharacterized protein n=1 Tax=Parafrankia soli TaxID=2599596 RepID=A0A1S1PD33_9ACTN|nr:hypothetical protein BBK14_08925 [Parafrankia soli]
MQLGGGALGVAAGGPFALEQPVPLELGLDPFGDVGLHAHEVGDLPQRVEHGADGELVPERRAVPPVVAQHDHHVPARGQPGAQLRQRRLVVVAVLQEPAVAPDHLGQAVAGHPLERRVRPDQRVVGLPRVGDREARPGGLQRTVADLQIQPLRHGADCRRRKVGTVGSRPRMAVTGSVGRSHVDSVHPLGPVQVRPDRTCGSR